MSNSSASAIPKAASPLSRIPPDIETHRKLLFALDTPVQLSPAVWDKFWPFIDNVWCLHQKRRENPHGIEKHYGYCRLARKLNDKETASEPQTAIRPRTRREGGTCNAKFRVTFFPDGLRIVERTGDSHSHDLDHIDQIKRNSGVRGLVLDDFFKSWEAGGILAFLKDAAHQEDGRDLLKEAGGLYLSRQEVQNIMNSALRKIYGQDISEVKKQIDKYKTYTTCSVKGCSAPAFPDIKSLMDHRKAVHGLTSHDHSDKQYACPHKSCWRRKKSKGFATLLGLEEHLREKHGEKPQQQPSTDPASQAPAMGPGHAPESPTQEMVEQPPPPEPSATPGSDSLGEDIAARLAQSALVTSPPAQSLSRNLSEDQKRDVQLRLQRLEMERNRLDQEIQALRQALYPEQNEDQEQPTG